MGPQGSVFVGKTLDEAVRKGLDALGLGRAEAMITMLEEGSGGFLGFGARPFKVRIVPRPGGAPPEPEASRGREGGRGRDRERGGRNGRRGRNERGGRGRPEESRGERRNEPARAEARPERGDRPDRPRRERTGESRGERDTRGGRRDEPPAERPARSEPRAERAGEPRAERAEPRSERAERRPERGPRGDRGERSSEPRGDRPEERRPERSGGPGREAEIRDPREPEFQEGHAESFSEPAGAGAGAPQEGSDERDEGRRRRRRGRRGGRGRSGATGGASEMSEPRAERAPASEDFSSPEPAAVVSAIPMTPQPVATHAAPERESTDEPWAATAVREESAPVSESQLADDARGWTEKLLIAMGFEAKVTARAEADRVDVMAEVSADEELLTGAKGEVRQALQHLLNRMINRGDSSRYHLQLEINDFWQRRERELEEIARSMAEDAITRADEVVSEYLNAQERRIIHVTLREDARVRTYALGTGMIKRIAVAPADFEGGPQDDA